MRFLAAHPKGSIVEGPIRNITEFGLFIGLDGGVDGMVHLSDLDWNKLGRRGDQGLQEGRQRQSRRARRRQPEGAHLARHQAARRRSASTRSPSTRRATPSPATVIAVQENGIEVKIADSELTTFVKRSDLSRDRSEQRPERFNVGDKVDAAVTSADKAARRIGVSIKALEIAEEKQAVAQYGSSDSGASLGDIFKAAIKKRETADDRQRGRSEAEEDREGVSRRAP